MLHTDALLHILATMVVVLDPVAMPPMFIALTQGMSVRQKRIVAFRSFIISVCILSAFATFGNSMLAMVGITLPAFRIAGGIMLFWVGFEMVLGKRNERKLSEMHDAVEDHIAYNLAVFPLAIPLIAGPGAITAVLLLSVEYGETLPALTNILGITAMVLLLILCIQLTTTFLHRFVSDTLTTVISKVLGLILAALAVQFVIDGVMTVSVP
jgi:multiple antibiotic resistance protein